MDGTAQIITITIDGKTDVIPNTTIFNVAYTPGTDPVLGDIVTPTGDLSNAAIIEYIEVNGVRLDVNANNYTFPGDETFSGTSLTIKVKVAGKDALETYSA
jgi:hypothetical protein